MTVHQVSQKNTKDIFNIKIVTLRKEMGVMNWRRKSKSVMTERRVKNGETNLFKFLQMAFMSI